LGPAEKLARYPGSRLTRARQSRPAQALNYADATTLSEIVNLVIDKPSMVGKIV